MSKLTDRECFGTSLKFKGCMSIFSEFFYKSLSMVGKKK